MSVGDGVTGAGQPAAARIWPHSGWAWFAVAALMVAYTSSFIDRQILTLLVQPIRADLTITDTQFSLLAGIAFSLFYTVMGVPLARLADRGSRRWIIFWGIVVWSVMTVACGLANSFWALFAARIGVGIGEAALSPAAYSMISDYFPPRQRARALAVYSMAPYLGAGLALMIGGAVIDAIAQAGAMQLPFVGELAPWQQTFVLVGAPGLLIAALFIIVREPPRHGVTRSGAQAGVLKYMWSRKATFYVLIMAFSIFGMAGISYLAWAPAVLIRQHGMTPAEVGFAYGAVLLAAATPGVLVGGWMTDWFANKGRSDAPVRVAVMNSLPATALQAVAPNQLRAQITAIYFLIGNLISLGLGPTIVAAISDNLLGGDENIGLSLAIVSGVTIAIAAFLLGRALKPFRDSVEEAREWQEPAR
ncbi:MAG: hypothetical protein B7Y86_06250 [Brevundimonas subvibrioides]|uniref:Major facilitator superfamily (MFS) profile domain-containing protein n=1 Tax=Brevundimonas subvibrioides TaxID=74313 RepID=A0A258HLV0_9CAUL|nr:MFS transporter [Brevundimonas subvibrioides]OYX57303.1 MAG: hypothetical protein B7Y86_06250 [Brevundimonas subvibrioides]